MTSSDFLALKEDLFLNLKERRKKLAIATSLNFVFAFLMHYYALTKDKPTYELRRFRSDILADSVLSGLTIVFWSALLWALFIAFILSILPWLEKRPTLFIKKMIVSYFWINAVLALLFAFLVIISPITDMLPGTGSR